MSSARLPWSRSWRSVLTGTAALALLVSACTGPDGPSPPSGADGAAATTTPSAGTAVPATPAPRGPITAAPPAPAVESPDSGSATQEPSALGAYGVSSGHPLASEAGMQMLARGGSAADAAVAAAFADAVLQPSASGIGGGGAAIVVRGGTAVQYDYREVVNVSGEIPADGVGVPGFVAGLRQLHEDHGRLPWADLLGPAADLAEEGAPVSRYLAYALAGGLGQAATADVPHFRRSDGWPLAAGDLLVQEELADTLRAVAEDPETVYSGAVGDVLAQVPGLDLETLRSYEVQVTEPAEGPVGGYTVVSGGPALPGAGVIQLLQVAEAAGIGQVDPGSAQFVDIQSQAWQIAERSVHELIGDPDFVDVPVDRLVDPERNAALAAQLRGSVAAGNPAPDGTDLAGGNTTHISVVDADGTAVSMTNTITSYWGSGRYVEGFFLGNALRRFGDIGSGSTNVPAPGRRSATWSAPSVLLDDQRRPVLVLGSPGGVNIPNILAVVVLRWTLHQQELDEAVTADRFVLTDGELVLESGELAGELAALGYATRVIDPADRPDFGSVQALEVNWQEGKVTSVADDRRSAGWSVATEEAPTPRTGP